MKIFESRNISEFFKSLAAIGAGFILACLLIIGLVILFGSIFSYQ